MIMHVFATSLEVLITETMAITSLQNSSNYLKLLHGNFTTALRKLHPSHGEQHSYPITQLLAKCQANINREYEQTIVGQEGLADRIESVCLADKRQTKKWQFGCQECSMLTLKSHSRVRSVHSTGLVEAVQLHDSPLHACTSCHAYSPSRKHPPTTSIPNAHHPHTRLPTRPCLLKGYMNDTHATKTEAPTQTYADRRHTHAHTQGRAREFCRGLGIFG